MYFFKLMFPILHYEKAALLKSFFDNKSYLSSYPETSLWEVLLMVVALSTCICTADLKLLKILPAL